MTKAKPAKTSNSAKVKAPASAKSATSAPIKGKVSTKTRVATKAKAAPKKHKAEWSVAIRQALQEKQAPKTWPGGGNAPWKGAPTKKN